MPCWCLFSYKADTQETEEDKKLRQQTAEEVSTTRIMTDEDFKTINMAQISKDINPAKSSTSKKAIKRKRQEAFGDENRSAQNYIICLLMCIT